MKSLPEVTGVSPSEGSVEGGTLLTVHGRFFDQTDQPARVLVGGNQSVQTWNSVVTTLETDNNWQSAVEHEYASPQNTTADIVFVVIIPFCCTAYQMTEESSEG